ncbi:MAG: hypothetical protein ACREQ5_21715, partial [Candidatus Dormibacteria bacterium]
ERYRFHRGALHGRGKAGPLGREVSVTPRGRIAELAFLIAIVLAVAVGGRGLLVGLAGHAGYAEFLLGVLFLFELSLLRRHTADRSSAGRIALARDLAFVAATCGALAFVLAPAAWSLGTCIAALEVGLVVAVLERLAPAGP